MGTSEKVVALALTLVPVVNYSMYQVYLYC